MCGLPVDSVHEITYWFAERYRGKSRIQDGRLEKVFAGSGLLPLSRCLSQWPMAVVMVLLRAVKKGWKDLNVGAERRVTCGHTQVLVVNSCTVVGNGRGPGICFDRGMYKNETMFVES